MDKIMGTWKFFMASMLCFFRLFLIHQHILPDPATQQQYNRCHAGNSYTSQTAQARHQPMDVQQQALRETSRQRFSHLLLGQLPKLNPQTRSLDRGHLLTERPTGDGHPDRKPVHVHPLDEMETPVQCLAARNDTLFLTMLLLLPVRDNPPDSQRSQEQGYRILRTVHQYVSSLPAIPLSIVCWHAYDRRVWFPISKPSSCNWRISSHVT